MSHRPMSGGPEPSLETPASPQCTTSELRPPSSGSTYSQYTTPREHSEASFELSRARLELAATARSNSQIAELRAALTASRRAERTRAAQLKNLRQDVKELMSLISGREDVLNRIDQLLDRSLARGTARDEYVVELQGQLADTRDQMAELCELHRIHVAKLDMEHDRELDKLLLKHEAELRESEEEANDLRGELDARSEQLASLQNALDTITSPRSNLADIQYAQSPYTVFSLPATPALVTSSTSVGQLDKTSPLSTLRAHNAALLKRIKAKDADVSTLEVALMEERIRVAQLQDAVSVKEEELKKTVQELQQLRVELDSTGKSGVESGGSSTKSRTRSSSTSSKCQNTSQPRRDSTSPNVKAKPSARSRSSSYSSSKLVSSKSATTLTSSTRMTMQSITSSTSPIEKTFPKSMSASQLPSGRGSTKAPPSLTRTASTTSSSSNSLKPAPKIGMGAARTKSVAPASTLQRSSTTPNSRERRVPSRSASVSKRTESNPAPKASLKATALRNGRPSTPTLEDMTNSPKVEDPARVV